MPAVIKRGRAYHSQRRDAQGRDTRRRVVAAAAALFLERGYASTTMRAVAEAAAVSVATVELLFGAKGRLLKAAIDVAIAGDDEPVAMLDREWASAARAAGTAEALLAVVADAVTASQSRSAGLVLAVFEGAARDADLARLSEQMAAQRTVMATWIVDGLRRVGALPGDSSPQEAVDTVWLLMDPAVFDRLTRQRGWSLDHYQTWFAAAAARLLT